MLVHSSDSDMGRGFQPGTNSGAKRWDVSAAASRQAAFSIRTSRVYDDDDANDTEEAGEEESTTPTAREARISERLPCPPAPRKKRASLGCGSSNNREFFCPPDLETVFTRRRQQPAK